MEIKNSGWLNTIPPLFLCVMHFKCRMFDFQDDWKSSRVSAQISPQISVVVFNLFME